MAAIAIVVLSEMALLLALLFDVIPLRKPNATAKAIGLLVSLGYMYTTAAVYYMIFENGVPSLKATTLFVCSIILACVIERLNPHMNEMETWRKTVSQLEPQLASDLELLKAKYALQKSMLQQVESVLPDIQNKKNSLDRSHCFTKFILHYLTYQREFENLAPSLNDRSSTS